MHLIRKHEPRDCFQFGLFDVKTHTKIQKFSKHGDSEGTLNERIRLPKHFNSVVLKTEKGVG